MKLKNKWVSLAFIIFLLIGSGALIYSIFLYKGVETFYRVMIILIVFYSLSFVSYSLWISFTKNKKMKYMTSIIVSIILTVIFSLGSFYLFKVYGSIDNMNIDMITYTTKLVSKDKDIKIEKIKDSKIGMIDTETDMEGYILPKEVIEKNNLDKENEIVYFSSTVELMDALYHDEVDYIFINGNFIDIFSLIEDYSNIEDETKIVYSYELEVKKNEIESDTPSTAKPLTDPFTILLLGIDSNKDGLDKNAAFNGDTIMLLSFNPKTMQATMLSIPRDTYVPISCNGNSLQKINSSAWGGTKCVIKTVENFTGIKIDYYAKINFKGVVELVDTLGGINVEVPYAFCEQDSSRRFGKHMIYVEKGNQKLNGEQALALARNRHTWSDKCDEKWTLGHRNDFVRGQNQQLVIEGLISEAKSIRSVNDITNLLDTISRNMDTNLTPEQLLSLYDIVKPLLLNSNTNVLNIQKTQLRGYDYGFNIYEPSARGYRYAFFHYKGSLNDITDAMKINLGLKKATLIKDFSFDINETYKRKVIGDKSYGDSRHVLVPNFAKYSLSSIKSFASKNGLEFKAIDIETKEQVNDLTGYVFISQNEKERTPVFRIKSITINVKKKNVSPPVTEDPIIDDLITEESEG